MKVGDMVNFRTTSWVMNPHPSYKNPGIIVVVTSAGARQHAQVMWADGRFTTEHDSYLEVIKND